MWTNRLANFIPSSTVMGVKASRSRLMEMPNRSLSPVFTGWAVFRLIATSFRKVPCVEPTSRTATVCEVSFQSQFVVGCVVWKLLGYSIICSGAEGTRLGFHVRYQLCMISAHNGRVEQRIVFGGHTAFGLCLAGSTKSNDGVFPRDFEEPLRVGGGLAGVGQSDHHCEWGVSLRAA